MTIFRRNIAPSAYCMAKGFPVYSVYKSFLIKAVAREFMTRHGLGTISVDDWYPMQSYLSMLQDVRDELGEESLYSLGRAIPYVIDVDPALLRNVETVLEGVNIAYYSVHKGGDLGSYKVEKIGMDCYHMICNTPYDHTLDHGILVSFIERAKARGEWKVDLQPMEFSPDVNNRGVFVVERV